MEQEVIDTAEDASEGVIVKDDWPQKKYMNEIVGERCGLMQTANSHERGP